MLCDRMRGTRRLWAEGRRLMVASEGSTAVEFALIALPFFVVLLAIFQVAILFLAQHELETAVEKTARGLLTGQTQQANMTQQQFTNSVCVNLPALFTCSNLMVDLQTAGAFSSADTSAPTLTYEGGKVANAWKFDTGASGSIMVLRVMYQFPVLPGLMALNLSNLANGSRLLMASAVFQAESY
ncbi:Flp pilus assembly protein TadG [Rhodoblastus acidophilus]|uniref:TadE/TadG family type IV pilus assembly protein n=1 Tax=Rhodoblastus acidophilus TaxID=1074 RepID=UPI002225AFFD|nr:TadE/TadG family type IV pilus assembly protein [Rhodoblastus acidophilus]MCW2314866.1 Flp pilus assembly protein TadG [Rhodoblastus acidophilus]